MKTLLTSLTVILSFGIAQSQTFCDSIMIADLSYSPFTDTAIYVHVINNSTVAANYPGFVLINSNGDTVAKEMVNFFVMGQEGFHMLEVYPGVHDPLTPFVGELHLWQGFWQTQLCVWPIDQGLCGDLPCHESIIAMNNWGGALALGDFDWVISTTTNPNVASGTLTTTIQNWYDADTVCLPPGNYMASVTTENQPSGGGPWITFGAGENMSPSLQYPFDWYNGIEFDIPYYDFCIGNPNAVRDLDVQALTVVATTNGIQISSPDNNLGRVRIYGSSGRKHVDREVNAFSTTYLPEASGVYIIQRQIAGGIQSVKVVWP